MYSKIFMQIFLASCLVIGCQAGGGQIIGSDEGDDTNKQNNDGRYACQVQDEQTDYKLYKMSTGTIRLGDVMPYFDPSTNKFYIYYLKNIWNDATNERHPWYGLTTSNFYEYNRIQAGEILGSSSDGCAQDYALGTGSIIKKGDTYYAFYTGHNPNYPTECVPTKEGIMLATSNSLDQPFAKVSSFNTIYAPDSLLYDHENNFRDPYVYYAEKKDLYYMIISARKSVNGIWKGVIAQYSSTDLMAWNYEGVLYDGGDHNFFMMETPSVFKMGDWYYLLFSDSDSRHVFYRKSRSINGPWHKPDGYNRMIGKGIYAAKTAANEYDRYIFGWTPANKNHSDIGEPVWGGNLVVHKLYQKANGDLAVTIPHTLESFIETNHYTIKKDRENGDVTQLNAGTHSYRLISETRDSLTSVVFEPVEDERYEISANFSYSSSSGDFGFMVGACDGINDFISLRFIPDKNKFRVDIVPHNKIVTTTDPYDWVPFHLTPNTKYNIRIVVENSMVVIYINDEVALSVRIYSAPSNYWGLFASNSNVTFSNITVTTP